jgi:hypothetical protein
VSRFEPDVHRVGLDPEDGDGQDEREDSEDGAGGLKASARCAITVVAAALIAWLVQSRLLARVVFLLQEGLVVRGSVHVSVGVVVVSGVPKRLVRRLARVHCLSLSSFESNSTRFGLRRWRERVTEGK